MISAKPLTNRFAYSNLPASFVWSSFKKSYRKFEKLCKLELDIKARISFLPDAFEKNEAIKILNDVKVWTLHYLVKDAKIPLFNQRHPLHLPFHEYLFMNAAAYFRGDGGSIVKIFKDHIRKRYPFLEGHKLGLVNPVKFVELVKTSCVHSEMKFYGGNYAHIALARLEDIDRCPQRSVVDVSAMLQGAKNSGELKALVEIIQRQVDLLSEETVVTGMVTIDGSVGLYILFEPSKGRSREAEIDIHHGLFGLVKNFRGLLGAFPDMLHIKRALVNQGFEMHALLDERSLDRTGETPSIPVDCQAEKNIHKELFDLEGHLEQLLKSPFIEGNALAFHYLSLIARFLKAIGKEQLRSVGDREMDAIFSGAVLDSQRALRKSLLKIEALFAESPSRSENERFARVLQELYLAFEEVIFLSLFFTAGEGCSNMEISLERAFPLADHLQHAGIQKSFFPFNSGMSCHGQIFAAHIAIRAEELNTDAPLISKKTQAVFIEGSYSELTADPGLKDYFEKAVDTRVMSSSQLLSSEDPVCDILLLDLHPNCVTMKEVKSNPVVALVRHALSARIDGQMPLTVVLDTTASLFSEPQVDAIIDELRQEIADGRLNFVISTSLAKFYNFGLDKHAGGLVVFYSSASSQYSDSILSQLRSSKLANPLSEEAQRFYSLLFSTSRTQIEEYYRAIKLNTQVLYDSLKGELQKEGSPIHLGAKDPDVIMLGLQFDHFLESVFSGENLDEKRFNEIKCKFVVLFKLYLYKKFITDDLPIHIRRSFSFPNASITEFATALRLVIGLEDKSILDQYEKHIKDANNQLKEFIPSVQQKNLRRVLAKDGNDFKKIIELLEPFLNNRIESDFQSFIEQLNLICDEM